MAHVGRAKHKKRDGGYASLEGVVAELSHRDRPRLRVVTLEGCDDTTEHWRIAIAVVIHAPMENATAQVAQNIRGQNTQGQLRGIGCTRDSRQRFCSTQGSQAKACGADSPLVRRRLEVVVLYRKLGVLDHSLSPPLGLLRLFVHAGAPLDGGSREGFRLSLPLLLPALSSGSAERAARQPSLRNHGPHGLAR